MKRFIALAILLTLLALLGTVGFHFTSNTGWLESLYLAVITLTTVGSREPPELDTDAKIFVMIYLVIGLGVFSYSAFQIGSVVVNAELRGMFERRKMQKHIDQMKDHYIVCGLGRMGTTICEYLQQRGKPFVVIDHDDSRLEDVCISDGWSYIHGDATDDQVLQSAGIDRAKSLASVLPTDADNVYVILSSRILNQKIQIVARASEEKAVEKMERAGASRVISPFSSGAVKIARFMINPSIEDFLEVADTRGTDWELADVQISPDSTLIGKQLMETDLRDRGVMVIGIRRSNGERLMPPPGNAIIHEGDSLFAFGSTNAVNAMISESTGDNSI
ncbi:MAG: potassium channel protein [Planctomycetaceae bacterium]|nr:potassium channel protein [Planctomycetaceae bacterium]